MMLTKDFSFVTNGGGLYGYGESITIINSFNAAKEMSGLPIRKSGNSSFTGEPINFLSLGLENSREYIVGLMKDRWDPSVWSFAKDFPTFKRVPSLTIEDVISTLDSISFNLDIVDFDRVGSIFRIELFEDGELVSTLVDITNWIFEDLKYSTQYEIKVT
jgi:hypothetical protein